MDSFVTLANHAEQLGIIGILIVMLCIAGWAIRHLYNSDKKCEEARLVDAVERGEIKKDLGRLEGRVESMAMLHQQHLASLIPTKSSDDD